jgi:hypothetical protein
VTIGGQAAAISNEDGKPQSVTFFEVRDADSTGGLAYTK